MNKELPKWLVDLMDQTRPALKAFNKPGRRFPDVWLYFANEDGFPKWFDWDELFERPVSNVSIGLYPSRDQDVECPLYPIWFGEELDENNKAKREFFLRFGNTGDFAP